MNSDQLQKARREIAANTEIVDCPTCGGDGKETCTNPEHGFIHALGGEIGRLGCPVCGHDENYKVPNGGECEDCQGRGYLQYYEL